MSLKTEGDISPELKVAARDLHYTLIEQYGLKDDPVSNHAIREGLHQLMRLAATASEKGVEVWVAASEKHAARYRWLRGCSRDALEAMRPSLLWGAEHLDEHIDAAMEKANG